MFEPQLERGERVYGCAHKVFDEMPEREFQSYKCTSEQALMKAGVHILDVWNLSGRKLDMAYAALLSVLQALVKVTEQDYFYNLFTIKQQITVLREKFCFLQDFLENDPLASEEFIYFLEERIREVAYRAEDVIDFYVQNRISLSADQCLVPRRVKSSSRKILAAPRRLLSLTNKHERNKYVRIESYVKLYQDFQSLMDEVDSILQKVEQMRENQKIEAFQFSDQIADADSSRSTAPGKETVMVGFDDDVMQIKDQLCGGSLNLKVISLVGMAGIGKTTLATKLFYDPLVTYYFDLRAWTTITQDHRKPNILRGILHSMTKPSENLSRGLGELDERVYRSLKGRRYLIVLDDIWSSEAWDEVNMVFPNDHNGSRIIITTRLVDVAAHANSSGHFHQMQFLKEEQSWNLLKRKVFGEEDCPLELEETGKWIARNCRGLPLSIIVVAGLLKINRVKYQWENVARDVSLTVTESEDEGLPSKILSLSYNHLPHHLKPCFLSMGGFPEDYQIPVFHLIGLWVAEGFLKPIESKSLEEVAELYLEDLVKRSLVLVTTKRSNNKSRFCSIHDLLRDLCISRARHERFLHPMNGIQESMEHKRRLCFSKCVEWFHFRNANTALSPVRSVFCCSYNDKVLVGFNRLKILHILEVNFESFPVEILQLLPLKFIAFTSGFIRYCTLPPSLPKLENLQTLIVGSSVKFNEHEYRLVAPLPIWDMPQLRHLVFRNLTLSPAPFLSLDHNESPLLENLQTLSKVKNFCFTREAIERIPNLKKLKAIYTLEVRIPNYELGNLIHFHQLETLNLFFATSSRMDHFTMKFGVPMRIKKLTLRGFGITGEDMRNIGSLPNLEVLKLLYLSVVEKEWEVEEGEFPRLKFLLMERLDLRRWIAEAIHFSSLERLIIRHCSRLERIPSGIGEIGTLEMMEVDHCSPLAAESAREIMEEQASMGNEVLNVSVRAHAQRPDFLAEALFRTSHRSPNDEPEAEPSEARFPPTDAPQA